MPATITTEPANQNGDHQDDHRTLMRYPQKELETVLDKESGQSSRAFFNQASHASPLIDRPQAAAMSGFPEPAPPMQPASTSNIQMQPEENDSEDLIEGKSDTATFLSMSPNDGGEDEGKQTPDLQFQSANGKSQASPAIETQLQQSRGIGEPLPGDVASEMGAKMGADFSQVNIHTDSQSAQMNKELGARAFTNGQDIYFNQDQYKPETEEGKKLLAHELTHTVQQKGPLSSNIIARKRINKDHYYFRPTTQFQRLKRLLAMVGIKLRLIDTAARITKPGEKRYKEYWEAKLEFTKQTPPKVKKALGSGPHFISKSSDITSVKAFVKTFRTKHPRTFYEIQVKDLLNTTPVNDKVGNPSCIPTFNVAIARLYGKEPIRGKKVVERGDLSGTAFGSISKLRKLGLAGASKKFKATEKGLTDSVDKWIAKRLKREKSDGSYVFLMSLFNGYHSVILAANKKTLRGGRIRIRVEWKDQTQLTSTGGSGLDKKINSWIPSFISHTETKFREKYSQKLYKKSYSQLNGEKKKEVDGRIIKNWKKDLKNSIIAPLNQKKVK